LTRSNCEFDRLNVSDDDGFAARHVHTIGWLLSQWWYNVFLSAFLSPSELEAVVHSKAIPARSQCELPREDRCKVRTELVWLFGLEGVEVSVFVVHEAPLLCMEHLLRWYRCVCVQVSQSVS